MAASAWDAFVFSCIINAGSVRDVKVQDKNLLVQIDVGHFSTISNASRANQSGHTSKHSTAEETVTNTPPGKPGAKTPDHEVAKHWQQSLRKVISLQSILDLLRESTISHTGMTFENVIKQLREGEEPRIETYVLGGAVRDVITGAVEKKEETIANVIRDVDFMMDTEDLSTEPLRKKLTEMLRQGMSDETLESLAANGFQGPVLYRYKDARKPKQIGEKGEVENRRADVIEIHRKVSAKADDIFMSRLADWYLKPGPVRGAAGRAAGYAGQLPDEMQPETFLNSIGGIPTDLLILFCDDRSPDCAPLVPLWLQVTNALSGRLDLTTVTMADPQRLAPGKYHHEKNPAIFFVPRDQKHEPIMFPVFQMHVLIEELGKKMDTKEKSATDRVVRSKIVDFTANHLTSNLKGLLDVGSVEVFLSGVGISTDHDFDKLSAHTPFPYSDCVGLTTADALLYGPLFAKEDPKITDPSGLGVRDAENRHIRPYLAQLVPNTPTKFSDWSFGSPFQATPLQACGEFWLSNPTAKDCKSMTNSQWLKDHIGAMQKAKGNASNPQTQTGQEQACTAHAVRDANDENSEVTCRCHDHLICKNIYKSFLKMRKDSYDNLCRVARQIAEREWKTFDDDLLKLLCAEIDAMSQEQWIDLLTTNKKMHKLKNHPAAHTKFQFAGGFCSEYKGKFQNDQGGGNQRKGEVKAK